MIGVGPQGQGGGILLSSQGWIVIVLLAICILWVILKIAFRGGKKTRVESAAPPQPSRKVVTEVKISGKGAVTQKCPHCGGDLSELSFYKLKAGNDVKCDYCDAIISGGK